jgi:acyl-CoA synthetase (AMP-forming)/AMP-acid ligase II
VVQTHGKNLLAIGSFGAAIGLREGDRNLVLAPLFAQFGLRCGLYIDIMVGATTVLDAVFDPGKIVALIERELISALPGPPTILAALLSPLAQGRDLSSLRIAITGSTIIPEELVIELLERKVFESVLTAYGLTEACGPVSVSSPHDSPATVSRFAGRVMDHLQIRVVDPDGRTLPAGERGELLVRSAAVMNGYLDDPEQTAAAVSADGWLRTGDIGLVTAEGYVRITGRLKDMYICGGFNVYPAEVEATFREHPEVRDVALIGIPDERLGEVGLAYLVLADGATLDAAAMSTWCRGVMANYKVPRRFVALDALPLNSSLKVDKLALRGLTLRPTDD